MAPRADRWPDPGVVLANLPWKGVNTGTRQPTGDHVARSVESESAGAALRVRRGARRHRSRGRQPRAAGSPGVKVLVAGHGWHSRHRQGSQRPRRHEKAAPSEVTIVAVLLPWSPVSDIPQKELRNNVGEVLRRAEAGETLTVTVAGRPAAELGPAHRRRWVSGAALASIWRGKAPQGLDADLERLPAGVLDPFAS